MIKNILLSLRPHFWILSIIPALSGAYLANNHSVAPKEFLLIAILIGPCLSGIAEIVNDYADRETDVMQKVKRIWKFPFSGGSGVVRIGGITKNETVLTTVLLSIVAFAIALSFNWSLVILASIGLFIALEYSLKPLHFKIRGIIGPLTFASGFRGLLSFHAGWLAFASASEISLSISIFLALLFFAGFTISHLFDYAEDNKLNIRTFPVSAGFNNAKLTAAGFFVSGIFLLPIFRSKELINVNCFALFWLPLSAYFLWKLLSLREQDSNTSRLGSIAMITVCTAPLIFF